MSEWNIQRVSKFTDKYSTSYSDGKYYIIAHEETWDIFSLDRKKINCRIARILDAGGNTLFTINEELILDINVRFY